MVLLAAPTPTPSGALDVVPVLTSTPFGATSGQQVTHTITLSAAGTGTVPAVRVTFRTTAGLDGVTARASPGSCPTVTGTSVVCELGNLTFPGAPSVTVTGTVGRGLVPGALVQNLVEVTLPAPDGNPGNDTVSNAYLIPGASASTVARPSAAAAPAPPGGGWPVGWPLDWPVALALALGGLVGAVVALLWWRRRRVLRVDG
jgi:hypothetical protein